MKISQIYDILNSISPFELQENWDNSGLQVGNLHDDVEKIYLSIDLDKNMLKSIEKNSLIITHHPLIFKGLKNFDSKTYPASLLKILVKKNISLISMHTNFDKTHLNRYVAKKILKLEEIKNEDFVIFLQANMPFDTFCNLIKKKLNLKHLRVVKTKKYIKTAAITTGSGGDFIENIKADCFLTGDIKYHQAVMAKENGLSLIDIGHYESECHFVDALKEELKNFPLKVIMSNSKNPFQYK